MLHFGTDTTPSYLFNACMNFYLFSKRDNSEILKLEIISSRFHQQQEPELGDQGEPLRLSAGTPCHKLLAGTHLHKEEMESSTHSLGEETWQKVLREGLVRPPEAHSGHQRWSGVCVGWI